MTECSIERMTDRYYSNDLTGKYCIEKLCPHRLRVPGGFALGRFGRELFRPYLVGRLPLFFLTDPYG